MYVIPYTAPAYGYYLNITGKVFFFVYLQCDENFLPKLGLLSFGLRTSEFDVIITRVYLIAVLLRCHNSAMLIMLSGLYIMVNLGIFCHALGLQLHLIIDSWKNIRQIQRSSVCCILPPPPPPPHHHHHIINNIGIYCIGSLSLLSLNDIEYHCRVILTRQLSLYLFGHYVNC